MSRTHCLFSELLDPQQAQALLHHAWDNETRFEPTGVGNSNQVTERIRKSRRLADLGPFAEHIEERVHALVPTMIEQLGLTPFEPTGYEMDLVASEDGAFYKPHIDLWTGETRSGHDRLISVVCYLHAQPRRFSGGELRLYPDLRPGAVKPGGVVEIAPEHAMAVAFSSWMPHEVLPVWCPSGDFRDARFSINCWVARHLEEGEATPPRHK